MALAAAQIERTRLPTGSNSHVGPERQVAADQGCGFWADRPEPIAPLDRHEYSSERTHCSRCDDFDATVAKARQSLASFRETLETRATANTVMTRTIVGRISDFREVFHRDLLESKSAADEVCRRP